MTIKDAYNTLVARMKGAPNLHDYCAWLRRQPDGTLFALAKGEPVHLAKPFTRRTA